MRKALLVLVLAGCAAQPQEPTEAQLAVIAYYAENCKKQGIDPENIPAMRGCVLVNYEKDVQSGMYAHRNNLGDVIGGIGSVYSAGGIRQTQCDSFPTYGGGFTTTCR